MENNEAMLACFISYLYLEKNASPHTILNYQADVRHFLEFMKNQAVGEEVLFHKVDLLTVRLYLAHLAERAYARSTVSRKITCLRRLFHFLCLKDHIDANPFLKVRLLKADPPDDRILSTQEVDALLDLPSSSEILGLRDRAILETMYGSGLRSCELVRLCKDDVDFDKRVFLIYGNGVKARVSSFGNKTRMALLEYLEKARPYLLKSGLSEALFLNKYGASLSERSVRRILDKYAPFLEKREKINPQMIRRSVAVHLLQSGVGGDAVRKMLGKVDLARIERIRPDECNIQNEYKKAHPRA